jgi:hypothetical protein
VLEACAAAAPSARVLLVSSAEVYGRVAAGAPIAEDRPLRPATAYALSKACAELAGHRAAARGARIVIVRPFNHIGPGQSDDYVASAFARQLARIEAGSQPPVLRVGNLEAVRDLTDVRDAASAYVAILERAPDGAVYNVTSGRATSVRQLLDGLVSLCRREVAVETDPARLRPIDVPVLHGSGAALERDVGPRGLARAARDAGRPARLLAGQGARRERAAVVVDPALQARARAGGGLGTHLAMGLDVGRRERPARAHRVEQRLERAELRGRRRPSSKLPSRQMPIEPWLRPTPSCAPCHLRLRPSQMPPLGSITKW